MTPGAAPDVRKAEEGLDLDAALTMAQRARQLAPNATAMADTVGWIYIKKNLPDSAIAVVRRSDGS